MVRSFNRPYWFQLGSHQSGVYRPHTSPKSPGLVQEPISSPFKEIYHARNYTEIEGDPHYDPNRHTRVQPIHWLSNGMPDFGVPVEENRTMEDWEGVPCHA